MVQLMTSSILLFLECRIYASENSVCTAVNRGLSSIAQQAIIEISDGLPYISHPG